MPRSLGRSLYRRTTKKRQKPPGVSGFLAFGADDEARTRYLHLGKVALYQMSYIRMMPGLAGIGASGRN